MADIFFLDKEARQLTALLEVEDILTDEERLDLDARLNQITEQKGNMLPQLFDIQEYLAVQNNAGQEKIDDIRKKMKLNERIIDRVSGIIKHIFTSTGQKEFQIGATVFKRRKLPARLEIINPDEISEDYKTVTITVPVYTARVIAFEHPELDLYVDDKKAEVKKSELKKLWQEGIETGGCKLIDDDFTVVTK